MQNDEIKNEHPALEQASVNGSTMLFFKPPPLPICIVMNSGNDELGRFYEADGFLTFDGRVDEAGQKFVDFVIDAFKSRIDELYSR